MASADFFTTAGPFSLQDLAAHVGGDLKASDGSALIDDVAPLDQASAGQISFFDNPKYRDQFSATKAKACIIKPDALAHAPDGCALIITDAPYKAYALIAQKFYPLPDLNAGIAVSATIDETAKVGQGTEIRANVVIEAGAEIGANVLICANTVIGPGVRIGRNCRIAANVTISHSLIGDNVTIHPGACIGQDGFGFAPDPTGHVKVPQLGRVIIQDNVDIGASTTIDRGAGPDTIIGEGTWIDNHVQVGHNVKMGRGCIIVAQVGIAGSAVLEDFVMLGGQSAVGGHITIGMGTQVSAQAGVIRNVPAGSRIGGSPAIPTTQWHRQTATLARLARPKTGPKTT